MTSREKSYIGAVEPKPHHHNISFQRQGRKNNHWAITLNHILKLAAISYSFRLGPPQVSLCAENINPRDVMINLDLKHSMGSRSVYNENAPSVNICLEIVGLTLSFRHKNLASFDRYCRKCEAGCMHGKARTCWIFENCKFTYLDRKARSNHSLHTVLWHPSKQWHCLPQKFSSCLVWALKTQDPDGGILALLPEDDRHSPRDVNSVLLVFHCADGIPKVSRRLKAFQA